MFPQRPRPTAEEDEDDLLRAQQEFLALKEAGKIQPSVSQVVKAYASDEKPENKVQDVPKEQIGSLTFDAESISALGELPIIERNTSNFCGYSFPKKVKAAFPKPTRRFEISTIESSGESSSTLGGACESVDYKEQNDKLLGNMSSEQILAMREEILSKLKPDQIEFLKQRKRKQSSNESAKTSPANVEEKMEVTPIVDKMDEDLPIPLNVIKEHNWLHMDVVEEEKLEWCRPVKESENASAATNARFDFSGNIVMDGNKSTVEGLHHHGDEPDRPGYSLPEIYTFIQSSFDSQKIIGLKILAKLMDKVHKGFYDNFFNAHLAQEVLDNTEIILSIRKCLDDASESIIREAIICLHALICNNLVDEACLDRFFPVTIHYNNFLFLVPNDLDKNLNLNELKDDQLVKIDVIKGLIRFDTLPRLRYLLDNNIKYKQDPTIFNKIMEILIRISRHSVDSCKSIVDCPYLIETIVKNFIPPKIDFANNSIYGNPSPKALKLVRLLMSDSSNCIKIMNSHIRLWDALQSYLTLDPDCFRLELTSLKRVNILQIAIETLRVWCILLSNSAIEPAKECFNQVYPVIYRQLQYCCTLTEANHKFDFQYAATLVKCLTWAVYEDTKFKRGYESLVQSILFQSVRDLVDINIIPPFDTLMMMSTCIEFLVKADCKPTSLIINLLQPLVESERIMKILGTKLRKCSYTLKSRNFENGVIRDAKSLPSFGAIYFGGSEIRFVDLAQDDSVVFFIESLLGAAEFTRIPQMISRIVLDKHILNYIESIIAVGLSKDESIFTQIEFTFLYQLCVSSLKVIINEEQLFYNLSLVSLYHLKDVKMKENLLNLIIFNSTILKKLAKPSDAEMEGVDNVKTIYFKHSSFDSNIWMFDPIINNYTNKNLTNDCKISDLNGTLQFIYFIMNTNYQLLTSMISPETLLCLISTIFLIDDRIFAEDAISNHLQGCLQIINKDNLFISYPQQKLPHISTFLHFFDLFMKQFESESFGDPVFINYLLIFLKPKTHTDFKKKIFSDYSVSLRYINLQPKDLFISMESLLYPHLDDLTLAELFLTSLLSNQIPLTKQSLIYFISVHHVHHALFKAEYQSSGDNEKLKKYHLSLTKCQNNILRDHVTNFMNSDLVDKCEWAKQWVPLKGSDNC